MTHDRKMLDREAVRSVIQQWNANRLDLFALSEPDENLLFHGVMRFYFQDAGQKVATKCIRVASDATVSDVIDTLIEKFRPDMRMLSVPNYALYEVHANGEERRLNPDEKPLLVQLNWHIDDREGRFLLKNIDQKTTPIEQSDMNFKRKLSKREKKEQKKKEKLAKLNSDSTAGGFNGGMTNGSNEGETQVAGKLYTELPETSFTRSISNPEAVMRRRRQQKLEKKLQQFRSRDGGPDTGGTLKIYGESLCQDVPYKTLLLSIRDCAQAVVREMLSKYGLDKADPLHYCLVQVNSDGTEYILDDDECPLSILMNHPTSRGSIMFHVRRRPADSQPRRRKKKPLGASNGANSISSDREGAVLVEVTHSGDGGRRIKLGSDPIEVGSANTNSLQLFGPSIQARHCLISLLEGVCTVTPLHTDALTFVNGHHISQPTILHNGSVVMFGRVASYRFVDSPTDGRYNLALSQSQLDSACLYESRSPTSPGSWNDEDGALNSVNKNESGGTSNNSGNVSGGGGMSVTEQTLGMREQEEHKLRSSDHNSHAGSTAFDGQSIEGNLENETKSISSLKSGGSNSQERLPKITSGSDNQGQEAILPAVLEFPETHQELFLRHIISELDVNAPHFKLAPVYSMYLCARYRASTHYRPELQPTERAHKLTIFLHHVANLIYNVVQEQYSDPRILAFWMANSSEFLHFLKSDRHISAFSVQAQEVLAESVQTAFRNLVNCFRLELSQTLNQFLSETIDHDSAAGLVLTVLGSAMALLRRCRVNAALTIQLFSQLFHYINVICFNTIVANSHMCTAEWGKVMSERLQLLELWAERQGLELAADCHLAKINQCAQFLQAPKSSVEEIQQLACSCFRLNSLQMSALLQQEKIPRNLVDTAIRMAESVADELTRSDGREVRLEESPELHLALLLPDDGFSCDVVRGIPSGLVDFLNPLQQQGMCRLAAQPTSIGLWTVYMHQFNARSSSAMSNKLPQPEVQVIKLHKNANGMGLSIVAAKGAGQERLGIYIKSVVPGGAADADGRLQAGDQLLRVDGQSLIGITQEKAADYLVRTGPIVTLEVAKQGAIYHGLATLLQQPSPVIAREPVAATSTSLYHDQRRHSMYTNRYFASASDDSLNRSRRESLVYVRSSSPPVRRLSASSLQEELCARGHQLHIDPRYRDTRPIARSVSSLYLSNENNLNNVQNNNNNYFHNSPVRQRTNSTLNTSTPPPSIYIEEYTDPDPDPENTQKRASNDSFANLSYTEAHQPLNEDGIASVADSDDIPFIDDGSPTEDVPTYVPAQKEVQQSQLLQRIERVPKPPPGIISNVRRNAPGYRKTVSFDLEETKARRRDSISLDRGTGINRKFHTHDAISKFARPGIDSNRASAESLDKSDRERMPLIQKIRRELNSHRSTSGSIATSTNSGSGSNSNRSSNESIEKMSLITKQTHDLNINSTTPTPIMTIIRPKRELNAIRATSGGGLSGNQQRANISKRSAPLHNPTNFVNITNTSVSNSKPVSVSRTSATPCHVRTGCNPTTAAKTNTVFTIKVPSVCEIESSSETVHNYCPARSLSHANIHFPNCPDNIDMGRPPTATCHTHTTILTLSQGRQLQPQKQEMDHLHQFSKPFGEGKVREMTEFFERNQRFDATGHLSAASSGMSNTFSKSASHLYPPKAATSPRKTKNLTQQEQLDILQQLKEWSLHGSSGKDYQINLQNSNTQNTHKPNETKQRIAETVNKDTQNNSESNAPIKVISAPTLLTPESELSISTTFTCDCPCCANCKKKIVTNISDPNKTIPENAKSTIGPTTPTFQCYDSCPKTTQSQLKRQRSVMSTAKGNTVRTVKRHQKQHRHSDGSKLSLTLALKAGESNATTSMTCPHSTTATNEELSENEVGDAAIES
ncbi:afadin isoform X4 [Zeugodacus cucurbitae]|uniref:afadin isoform X4 n=1 Tax=Zeugodacus cucurbitae TaxID=28588 RepID=UPI0023D92AA7|nr:afadin isoform X4 [Zeugodacus cucurbitae]